MPPATARRRESSVCVLPMCQGPPEFAATPACGRRRRAAEASADCISTQSAPRKVARHSGRPYMKRRDVLDSSAITTASSPPQERTGTCKASPPWHLLPQPAKPARQAVAFEFDLPYSEDWLEIFDGRIEQILREIEEAAIPQELIASFCLSIQDASGCRLLSLTSAELEASGIPLQNLFPDGHDGLPACFPLRVRLGPEFPVITTAKAAQHLGAYGYRSPTKQPARPISPSCLHAEFLRNLCRKPILLGGPVSLGRVEELCEILIGAFEEDCRLSSPGRNFSLRFDPSIIPTP
eukprot:TRINITY_DN8859_c0_g1_i10.p1 TRINITY_DN8859_c0_g1~~TRINITY_DN8859_c0_g1_i10.p1  ORF type:complete len:294 (-),score=28.85 TRINITY_DN8859_c0_g1_i10:834-1715(-)